MSTVTYLLPFWGGCEGYLLKSIQILQNKAARQVTRLSRYTTVRRLQSQCNWLNFKQLIFYQSALAVYRTVKTGVISDHPLDTRLERGGSIRLVDGVIFLRTVLWERLPIFTMRSHRTLQSLQHLVHSRRRWRLGSGQIFLFYLSICFQPSKLLLTITNIYQ